MGFTAATLTNGDTSVKSNYGGGEHDSMSSKRGSTNMFSS